jgi:hypothetical protein
VLLALLAPLLLLFLSLLLLLLTDLWPWLG